jgi:hypothetical protein
MFTPRGGPRVTDKPILLSIFFTISYKYDGVVNVWVNLIAAVEDATIVGTPVASINGD